MATPRLISVNDFTSSTYSDLADQTDALLSDVLIAAEDDVERSVGFKILEDTYTESFRAKSQTLFVKQRPVNAIVELKKRVSRYSVWQVVPSTDYYAELGAGYIEVLTPVQGYDVQITYSAGFSEVPADIKTAIILQAALNLAPDLNLYGAGTGKPSPLGYMDVRIARLIAPYKRSATPYR